MSKNKFNKYKVFLIYSLIFLSLFILSYFFPISGNDYFLHKDNIISRLDLFQFGYIGDYLAIIMVRNRLFRALITSSTIFVMSFMVGKIVNKDNKNIPILFMFLLSIVNSNILLKTVVNISGFTTYFFPLMLLSIYIYFIKSVMKKIKYTNLELVVITVLSFIVGLFNDYLSMFMIFSNLYFYIYILYKNKKFDFRLFLVFIVSILSLILMFNSVDILYGTKHVFNLKNVNVNFITNGIRNYFNIIQNSFLTENYLINIIISSLLIFLINNNKDIKNNIIIKLLSFYLIIFNIFIVVINIFEFNVVYGKIHYFISIISFIYMCVLFLLTLKLVKKNECNSFLYLFVLLFFNICFYSISFNLKDSAIIYLFYLYILIILELFVYLKKFLNSSFSIGFINLFIIFIIFIIFIGALIYIYSGIYTYNLNRNNVIYNKYKQGHEVLYMPKDNYSKYVNNNYPINERMEKSFLKFLNIDSNNIKFEYIENSSIKYKLEFEKELKYDNLMIVAHPDDELIWGGKELMDEDYVVVCVTCGDNIDTVRVAEFTNVMNELNDEFIMLGHTDLENGKKSDWNSEYDFILNDIENIINYKNWNKIVVHSPFGESGHIHHKLSNKITTSIVDDKNKLYYFAKYYFDENEYPENTLKIDDKYVKEKDRLFKKYYKSQSHVKFEMFYPYERLYSYKEWHLAYDPKYEYN